MAEDFNTLLEELVQDTYSAEMQLVDALPQMAEAAHTPALKKAFQQHLKQTEEQVKRLEQAAEMMDIDLEGEDCEAMEGLVAEGEEIIENHDAGPVRDAALICAAQKVEHYEIAAYGSLVSMATAAGMTEAAALFSKTLAEEKDTDVKLTELAEGEVNPAAIAGEASNDSGKRKRGSAA